jgi:Cro/C1-type HTH DNA-binding domain
MAAVTLKLREYLETHQLNARQVEREAGIGENTIYRVMKATNLNRDSLAGIISALRKLTGQQVSIADVLEYSDDTPTAATTPGDPNGFLALIGLFNDPDSPGDISAKHDQYLGQAQNDEYLEQIAPPKRKTSAKGKRQ